MRFEYWRARGNRNDELIDPISAFVLTFHYTLVELVKHKGSRPQGYKARL